MMFVMKRPGVQKTRRAQRGRRRGMPRYVHASAFTLIELLVVIAIIAILISLMMPSLRGALDTSRQVTCRANLRRIVAAALAYSEDRRGQLPDQINWSFVRSDRLNLRLSRIWVCGLRSRKPKGRPLITTRS